MSDMTTVDIRGYPGPWPARAEGGVGWDEWELPAYGQATRDIAAQSDYVAQQQALVQTLYTDILQRDPLWHFFLEPQGVVIIRVSAADCLADVEAYLKAQGIAYRTYPYPSPGRGKRDPRYYGEGRTSVTGRYNALFLPVFHANAVAAMTLAADDYSYYVERLVHCACNPRWYWNRTEVAMLDWLRDRRARMAKEAPA